MPTLADLQRKYGKKQSIELELPNSEISYDKNQISHLEKNQELFHTGTVLKYIDKRSELFNWRNFPNGQTEKIY